MLENKANRLRYPPYAGYYLGEACRLRGGEKDRAYIEQYIQQMKPL